MARAVMVALALAATSVAMTPACGSDGPGGGREDVAVGRLYQRLCDVANECGCELGGRWCGPWQEISPPGTFDEECLDQWAQWAQSLECGASTLPELERRCPPYHGTIYEGMPCNESIDALGIAPLLATDCGGGLVCVAGLCRDADSLDFGAPGQPCRLGLGCDEGLYCTDEGTCERVRRRGEPCPDDRCEPGTLCDEVCMVLPAADQPCLRGRCAEGLGCDSGVCRRQAAVGEPCFGHRDCASLNCPAGFCVAPPRPGDPCSGSLPCGPGASCIDQVCQDVSGDDGGPEASTCELLWLGT